MKGKNNEEKRDNSHCYNVDSANGYGISLYQNRTEPINDKLWSIVKKIHAIEIKIKNSEDNEEKTGQVQVLFKEITHLKRVLHGTYTDFNLVFVPEPKLEEELHKYLVDKSVYIEMMKVIKAKELN